MNIDIPFIESNTATFLGAVVTSIGTLDPTAAIHVRNWERAVTMVAGKRYPFNHVGGVCTRSTIAQIAADYPTTIAPFAIECAPVCQTAQDLIAFREIGLTPRSSSTVLIYAVATASPRIAESNLVWSPSESQEVSTDYVASDAERVVRRAYGSQADATIVSLLHSDGIIASAGVRIAQGYAFCFGAWVAPHRRRRGHYATLLDARLWYAREQGCHTVVIQTHTRTAVAYAARERGFIDGWERQRWIATAQRPQPDSEEEA
jgi:hypothetical protein